MRYVPTASPPHAPAAATAASADARRVVSDLRRATERRAWPARSTHNARPLAAAAAAVALDAPATDDRRDALVALLAELRVVTARYACGLRTAGARPEQMLVQVKAFVRDAMVAEGWQNPETTQALTAQVVGWSIAAYYDQ